MDPDVIVLPSPTTPGMLTLFTPFPLSSALTIDWPTDAHLALYQVQGETLWPRINKEALSDPDLAVALSVGLTALDYDLPNHDTARATEATLAELVLFFERNPGLAPTHLYMTRGGARFLYVHTPVTPDQAESLHQQLVKGLATMGLACDTNCWEWNRLFRMPKATRDGVPLKLPLRLDFGGILNLDAFDLTRPPTPYTVLLSADPQPEWKTATAFVWGPTANHQGTKLTQWGKEAQRRLKNRLDGELDLYFEKDPLPLSGKRNDSLMRSAGSICAMLYGQIATTPQHVFGLMLGRTLQSLKSDGRDLPQELWKMISYCWAHEEGLTNHNVEATQAFIESLPDNPPLEDLLPRLVLKTGKGSYYTMRADGYYDHIPTSLEMIPNALDRAGLVGPGKLISLQKLTNQGVRAYTQQEILREYVMQVEHEVIKKPGPPFKGWLEDRQLVFGSYSRSDLEPKFDLRVDRWLKALGGDQYLQLELWLGLALAFERGPICALSIRAPKGAGKGFLLRGLTEATTPAAPAATSSVFGNWQYHMEDTPWIHVDEGWREGSKDISVNFRTMISGGGVETVQKYGHPKIIYNNPRIVITANNRGCVERLFSAKDLTRSDVDAIAQRLFHIDADDSSAAMLAGKGGYSHTRGWVGGYNQEPSEFTLARHFLWIYEKHKDAPAMGRFLMESMTKPALIAWLSMKSEHVAIMAQTLLIMFQANKHDDGWVKIGDVKTTHDNYGVSRNQYTIMDIGRHLRLLTVEKDETRRRKIDMQKLSFFANEVGKTLNGVEA
jgi:hypothetical protein